MAHNLEIRNGVASFASTQTAWHGLGQIVGGAMTAQEAIRLAHLDYEVVRCQTLPTITASSWTPLLRSQP